MDSWSYFCYTPVLPREGLKDGYQPEDFILWKNGDFGLCFMQVSVAITGYTVLSLASGYYSGSHGPFTKGHKPSLGPTLKCIVALCLLVNSIFTFISSFWLVRSQPYSIILSQSVEILSWSLHAYSLTVLSRSLKHTGYGPLPLNLSWGLTLLYALLDFRTSIQYIEHPSAYTTREPNALGYLSVVLRITSYVRFGLQLVYLGLLLVPAKRFTDNLLILAATGSTQYQDKVPILGGGRRNEDDVISSEDVDYGSIGHDLPPPQRRRYPLTSEDNANPLSLLSFWWLTSLMRRGADGYLQGPSDLPVLPRSLTTARVREKFQRILSRRYNQQKGGAKHGNEDRNRNGGAISEHTLRSLDRLSQYSREQSITCEPVPINEEKEDDEEKEEHYLTVSSSTPILPPSEAPPTSTRSSPTPPAAFSLLRTLNRAFGLHYYPLGLMKLAGDCLGFAGPLLLHQLVGFMENTKEPISHGYYYALGLFLSTLIGALLNAHFTYQMNKVGLKIRASLVTEIFRKALSVNMVAISKFSTGEVVDFMSTDADRIVNFCSSFHQFWSLPFQIAVSLYLLYVQVGIAFLGGLAFTILLIPINRWLAVKIGKLSTAMMAQKDSRVKIMSEVLNGIRVIKFYAWERNFSSKINGIRNEELKSLRGRKYLDALCVYFWATTPVLISILTFSTYAALGHKLTAAKVFTSVALFNMLISPLNAFPWVLNGLVESWVSIKRVQKFLEMEELDYASYYLPGQIYSVIADQGSGGGNDVVSVIDGSFTWRREDGPVRGRTQSSSSFTSSGPSIEVHSVEWLLEGININIKKGEFFGITGKVGSGKSSLLSALMADMRKKQGQVYVATLYEGFAYVAQEAWIQYATVRDNILFGMPFNADKYGAVVRACALEPDFQILPAGDMTEVGENGVTLSGGQKARIALARAVYQDKEVYLLDDPLAAVDAHVASHLFTHCVMGLLRKKTRILSTHHTKFLQQADVVIVFNEGKVSMSGPPSTVLPAFESGSGRRRRSFRSSKGSAAEVFSDINITEESTDGIGVSVTGSKSDEGVLVKEEEREEGVVKFSVYKMYWQSVGVVLAPMILLSLFLMQASRNVSDWWLAYWITHSQDGYPANMTTPSWGNHSNHSVVPLVSSSDNLEFYLGIYGGLAFSNSVFTLFRAFLYAYGGIVAAKTIHRKLLLSILKAPVWFFDITPIGRILNRFSSDLYAIDDSLPFIMNILLAQIYGLLGTLVVTCYGLPWFLVVLVPLTVLYYYIQKYYRRTSRELKRLSTVTLSPIYAHFQETIMGLSTIRAMRADGRFMMENERRLEMNQRANYAGYGVGQWLSLRLQMLGVAMVAGVSFIAVLEHHFASVNPGLVGLAISYALSVTNLLSGAVTSFTETEKEMVSVERAMQYIRGTPEEDGRTSTTNRASPTEWPTRGEIVFHDVVLKYRESLPPSLKGVSFTIRPTEKVGVVGRTGAGKTSLFQALFRMVDPLTSGTITIDGMDIANIPLETLRSSMAIIPQDPFLFSGSIRDNLDPCSKFSDNELWSALERCNLKEVVRNLGGLDREVEERGRVFSVGQRQLVCLCRALLINAKVICIDEATASVDLQTDVQIQQAIRLEFGNSTVITIAHRIDTVLNYNRILVMDGGKVQEFDSPGVLLGDSRSLFSSLFNEHARNNRN